MSCYNHYLRDTTKSEKGNSKGNQRKSWLWNAGNLEGWWHLFLK